jgi:hypothetical protein
MVRLSRQHDHRGRRIDREHRPRAQGCFSRVAREIGAPEFINQFQTDKVIYL